MKRIISALLIICMVFVLVSCNSSENNYKDIELTEISEEGVTWPEGQAMPSFAPVADMIDAVDITSKGDAVRSLVTCFAGIINRKQPRVMIYTKDNEKWPEEIGIDYTVTKNESEIILKYKDEISGLVVWDTKVPDTINLATAVAGLNNALVVNEKLLETYSSGEFSFPIIEDFRGKFEDKIEVYNYLYDNYWEKCTKRLILGIMPNGWEIRDLATAVNAVILWLDPKKYEEVAMLDKFFKDTTPGETFYSGWWTSEGDGVTYGSTYGVPTVPADYYYNYTLYAGTSRELDIPTVPAKPELENKFYISFTFSEGDNLQYVQHAMKNAGQLWPSKDRGKYPINWTCAAALLDAGPQILNYFYKTATDNDVIVSGPSGLGYAYPTEWGKRLEDKETFIKYIQNTDKYFRRTGMNIATIWNHVHDKQAELYAQNARSLVGLTVQERYGEQLGQITLDGKIPLITTAPRYDGDIPRVQGIIENVIDDWDGESPAFMIPQIVSWETGGGVPGITRIAKALEKKYPGKVEFVRGDHIMMLYSEAHDLPYNVALRAENVTSSGNEEGLVAENVFDGSFSKDKGWQYSGSDEKYITVDLQKEYTISRYVVKNAACAYYPEDTNTKGFKVQYSNDGEKWTNVDVVKGNKSNIVDKDVEKFTAQYVRLYITDAGADNIARIQEFELYGIANK